MREQTSEEASLLFRGDLKISSTTPVENMNKVYLEI